MTEKQANDLGYYPAREIPGQGWCGIRRMVFTCGLFINLDDYGYSRRYCYGDELEAKMALSIWDGQGDPPGMWIKEKPSERLGPGAKVESDAQAEAKSVG